MTLYGPSSAFIIVGGRDLTTDTYTLSDEVEYLLESTHSLGDTWEESKPIGIARVMLEAGGGLYDDRTAGNVEALQANTGVSQRVCYGLAGSTNGSDATLLEGAFGAVWKRMGSRDGLTKAHATYRVTGRHARGRVLHGRTAETTDPGNTEGANSVDQNTSKLVIAFTITNITIAAAAVVTTGTLPHGLITGDLVMISGSNSTPTIDGSRAVTVISATTFSVPITTTVGGSAGSLYKLTSTNGIADLHVLALTLGGFTNVIVKVRHSLDNSTFADLATFTAVTLVNANERMTITGTINRYTAVSWDFTGAGSGQSITFFVALARDN